MTIRTQILAVLAVATAAASSAAAGSQRTTEAHGTPAPHVLLVGSWHGKPGEFGSIEAAVEAARPGDWILIGPGDYHERPDSRDGVRITTPNLHLRGMTRAGVVVDGTLPGAPVPCDPQGRSQNLGPDRQGRNGIVVEGADHVSIDNLTVCNFVGGRQGRQIAFDGGYGSGTSGLGAFEGSYLTATSTFASSRAPALDGIFVSDTHGPGEITRSFASNMADSAFHIGACANCNTVFDHDTAEHNVIALTAIDAGGNLTIERSTFQDNTAGIDLASEEDESSPPPQDGACPQGDRGPIAAHAHSCTIVEENLVDGNNDPKVPGGQGGVLRLIGAGILIAGGRNDTIIGNIVRHQGAYGIVLTPYPWLGRPTSPRARCQGGRTFSVPHVPLCFFNAYGNLVADNHLSNNGWFANQTNADLADAAISGDPANCFARNTSPNGAPTTYPPRLQRTAAECRSSGRDAVFFGPLGAQIACATQAFGPCTDRTVSAALATLEALAETVHAHTGALSSPTLARTRARYPTLTAATAPKPPSQPTMPDPCLGVPTNPWCPTN